MKKIRLILLIVLGAAVLAVAGFVKFVMREGSMPEPDYDDPESLWEIATRTERYIIRANPGRESSARKEALNALNDIALLDIPDGEKRKLIRERFPEESFWPDELKALLRKAESGDAEAQFRLGYLYFDADLSLPDVDRELGKHIEFSIPLAAKWYRKAALQGHVDAQFLLAMSYATYGHPLYQGELNLTDVREERVREEIEEWSEKAGRNGCPYAIAQGYGVPDGTDPEEWCEKGAAMLRDEAERGNLLALSKSKQPFEVYLKAAANGSVFAMLQYADLLRDGAADAEPDEAAADEWDRKALAASVKQLENGETVGLESVFAYRSKRKVLEALDKLAGTEAPEAFASRIMDILWDRLEQGTYRDYGLLLDIRPYGKAGDAEVAGQFNDEAFLRRLTEYAPQFRPIYAQRLFDRAWREKHAPEEGTPELMNELIETLRLLAGLGCRNARTMLGECYLNGIGVPEDKEQAVEWFRMAAEQRDWSAAYILGDESLRDDGAPPGWLEAKKWRWRTAHSKEEWTGADGFKRIFSEWYDTAGDLLVKLEKLF